MIIDRVGRLYNFFCASHMRPPLSILIGNVVVQKYNYFVNVTTTMDFFFPKNTKGTKFFERRDKYTLCSWLYYSSLGWSRKKY